MDSAEQATNGVRASAIKYHKTATETSGNGRHRLRLGLPDNGFITEQNVALYTCKRLVAVVAMQRQYNEIICRIVENVVLLHLHGTRGNRP